MSKNKNQNPPTPPPEKKPDEQKILVNAMDVFRTADAKSKSLLTKEALGAIGSKRTYATDGFDNFISRLGLNNDNAMSAGTYEFNLITKNRLILEAAYRGSWIVGQVVDSVAEDMTRAGIDITTNKGDEEIKKFEASFSRLQIWQSIASLIKWGRIYGGAMGVIQIEGQKLDTPLNLDTVAKNQFRGIVVYDRWQLNPILDKVIESGPETGLPRFYQIVTTAAAANSAPSAATDGMITVHHSRVIRYTGIDLPFWQAITESMWGESILERLWDRLISFDNATLSSAQLIDRANLRTVKIESLRTIIAGGGEAYEGLLAMFEMMRSVQVNEGLTLLDKEDDFEQTAYSFAGLSDMMLQFGQQLAGASGIPLVRLFGQSPAGLNSTGDSDIRLYYDNINAQQEAKLRNPFEVLLKVMWRSVFGEGAPDDLEFTFTPLWQMSALDKANVSKNNTETILGAYEGGLISRAGAMKELRQDSGDTGLFSNITDEEITEAEDEPPMPGEVDPNAVPEPGGDDGPVKALDRIARWFKGTPKKVDKLTA